MKSTPVMVSMSMAVSVLEGSPRGLSAAASHGLDLPVVDSIYLMKHSAKWRALIQVLRRCASFVPPFLSFGLMILPLVVMAAIASFFPLLAPAAAETRHQIPNSFLAHQRG